MAAPTEEDAAEYTTLLQIISIPLAARTKSHIDTKIGLEHAMWPAVDRRGDPKIIVGVDEEPNLEKENEKTVYTYTGYPLLPFEEFKEKALERTAKNIYDELRDHLSKDISPVEFVEFVKRAADAAEKIVEEKKGRARGTGFQPIDGDLEKKFPNSLRQFA